MLEYNTWTIQQHQWLPEQEASIEQQLTFSNDYLCQTAHFEEHYSAQQRLCTFIKGIDVPIVNPSAVSIRLQDERLDLAHWQVQHFSRCLHKNQPLLERHVIATSPLGNTLEITAKRILLTDRKETMQLHYTVRSVNYTGPITILSLLRSGDADSHWFALMNHVGDDYCWTWEQLHPANVQVCCAMRSQLYHNNKLVTQRPIKVEKQEAVGYSTTQLIAPDDVFVLHKDVVVLDSLRNDKNQLVANTLQCLTNW